jgi:hypothetical protein
MNIGKAITVSGVVPQEEAEGQTVSRNIFREGSKICIL